jgi:hypothetical protein
MTQENLSTGTPAKFSRQPPSHGRPIKFTPERLQQIRNLVERGKSREEIAEITRRDRRFSAGDLLKARHQSETTQV